MSTGVHCPACNQQATVPDSAAGKKIRCSCGATFTAPMPLRIDDIALEPTRCSPVLRPNIGAIRHGVRARDSHFNSESSTRKVIIGAAVAAGLLTIFGLYILLHSAERSTSNGDVSSKAGHPPTSGPATSPTDATQDTLPKSHSTDLQTSPQTPKDSEADRLYAVLEKPGSLAEKISVSAQWLERFSGDKRSADVQQYHDSLVRRSALLDVWAQVEKVMPEITFYNLEGGEHPHKEAIRLMRARNYEAAWKLFSAAEDRMSALQKVYERAGDREQMLCALYNADLMQFYEHWALTMNCIANEQDSITDPETVGGLIRLMKSIEQQILKINTELDAEPQRPLLKAIRILVSGLEPLARR